MNNIAKNFIKTAKLCGIQKEVLESKGKLVIEKDQVVLGEEIPGMRVETRSKDGTVEIEAIFDENYQDKQPLFFCFGVFETKGRQNIVPRITIEDGVRVSIVAHCSFPHSKNVSHLMDGIFHIGKNAQLDYREFHYHGEKAGAEVLPVLEVLVGEGGVFNSEFILSKGSVGNTKIEVAVHLEKEAKTEILSKVLGKGEKDRVEIIDRVFLRGENSKSLVKMRAAAKNGGRVFMQGETYASVAGAVGHVDCQEILSGERSVAKAVPIVEVSNDRARVTHEASVGRVNQKELETLLTRGLSEEEAEELIIEGLMR